MSTGRRPATFRSAAADDVGLPPALPPAQPSPGFRPAHGAAGAEAWANALIKAAVIVFACAWMYSPSLRGDWLWDDDTSITNNPVVQTPDYDFWKVWVAPAGTDYFPLTATGFWLQWQLFAPAPGTPPEQMPAAVERLKIGYHAVNILLHTLAALLLWRLMNVMKLPGGWLAGMLFAVHPIGVESVSWVSELKNTLCQPLFLLAAIHFVLFDDAEREQGDWDSPRVWGNYALAVFCFLLAMFAKTSVVMFPVVILLYAWWKRGRVGPLDIVHSTPFFLVSLLLGLMTIYYQHGRAIGQEKMPIDGILPRFAIAGMAIPFYLWKAVWPFDLLPIYPQWQVQPPKWWQFLPWPLMAGAFVWLCTQLRPGGRPCWARNVLFALGFFVLMLLPILGFVTISFMRITWVCDHFLYLPMISLIMLGTAAAAGRVARADATEQRLAVAAAALLIAVLAFSTFRYAHVWFNEDTQWTYTLASNPDAWQAHNRLGAWKSARGDTKGAHEHFRNSSRLRPDLGETHNNLGTTHLQQGHFDEAIAAFEKAAEVTPHMPLFRINLLNALLETGRLERLDGMFLDMLEKDDPAALQFLLALGQRAMAMENAAAQAAAANRPEEAQRTATAARNQFAVAAAKYKMVLDRQPRNAVGWNNLAVMLMKQGRREEAVAAFEQALAIAPDLLDARMGIEAARQELAATGTQQAAADGPRPAQQPEMQPPPTPTLGPPTGFGK